MADAREMDKMTRRFRDRCVELGRGEGILNESLREAFADLEAYILLTVISSFMLILGQNRAGEHSDSSEVQG